MIIAPGDADERLDVHLAQPAIVIANATGVLEGQEPDPSRGRGRPTGVSPQPPEHALLRPDAVVHGRHGPLLQRREFGLDLSGGKVAAFLIISLAIVAVLELNALGIIGGTGPGPLKWCYESVQNVIISAFVPVVRALAPVGDPAEVLITLESELSAPLLDAQARQAHVGGRRLRSLRGQGGDHAGLLVTRDVADQRVGAGRQVVGPDLLLPGLTWSVWPTTVFVLVVDDEVVH